MAVGGPQHELSLSLSPTLTLPLSLTLTCSLARGLAHHQARVSSNGGGGRLWGRGASSSHDDLALP